jgi:Tfp pilus assembly protein PilN
MIPPTAVDGGAPETAAVPLRQPVPLAPAPERIDPLNLARRPFLNSRPVVRTALLLWLLGFLLLLGNVSRFWSYRQSSADKREQIDRGRTEIDIRQRAAAQLQHKLDGFDLEAQNQRVDFLNQRIAERTFSWSQLLDRIAERLPHDVRLNRLAPLTGEKAERALRGSGAARRASQASDQVTLSITGETRNDEALLSFVDSLFKAPFADPNLIHEARAEDGKTVKFEISVQYRPSPPAPATPGAAGTPAPRIEELPMPDATKAPAPAPVRPPAPHPPGEGRP